MVGKVVMNLDLSKASGPDYILAELFNKCLKESCFHLEKCGIFSDFQYGFRSSQSTDLLTVVYDRIARAFNRSGAT